MAVLGITDSNPWKWTDAILVRRRVRPLAYRRRPIDKRSAKSFIRINEKIRAREVRVIDDAGNQLGILPPFEALKIARERGLGPG